MISVVMPVYNGERFLEDALRSILTQTFTALEVIVVDDGSTDRSPNIVEQFASRDLRVRLVRGEHRGISAALNTGIAAATNPWIARMDADDVAAPDRFRRQLAAAAAHPQVVVWGSYARHINASGTVLGLSATGPTSVEEFRHFRATGKDVYVIHPTALLRTEVVRQVGGYDSRFDWCEDFELFDRMSDVGPVVAIPEPLLLYRIHAHSISMERYFTMQQLAHFVRARRRARQTGEILTYEQFASGTRRQSAMARITEAVTTRSGFYYRNAGLSIAEGALTRAGFYFAASALMNPCYALPRAWKQVIAPTLHRAAR